MHKNTDPHYCSYLCPLNVKVAEGDICQLKRDLQWEQVYRPKMNQASFQVLNDHGQVFINGFQSKSRGGGGG